MIRPEQTLPLFLEACPGLQPIWARHVVQTMSGKSFQQNPLSDVLMPYVLGHVRRNSFKELPAAFAVIETLLSEGDEKTRVLIENEILVSLQDAVSQSPRTASVVHQWLGPRTQAVWQVIERIRAKQEQAEQERLEQHLPATRGYSFEEARPLYAAFGLIGGGPTGLTYMGMGGGESIVSLGALLLIWVGLSLVERFQRRQFTAHTQAQESSENDPETNGTDRFMVQRIWQLLDGATVLLLVLGIPMGLSIVLGHKIFLDSSLLDLLVVVIGIAVLVALVFRDRLWKKTPMQENVQAPCSPHSDSSTPHQHRRAA